MKNIRKQTYSLEQYLKLMKDETIRTELAISESQERMACVVRKGDVEKFIKAANDENLNAVVVAEVTNTNKLIMKWRGKTAHYLRGCPSHLGQPSNGAYSHQFQPSSNGYRTPQFEQSQPAKHSRTR